ncbi:MAG: hypothetical protein H5T41_02625 [Methanomassiliicoccales archaeon]|nr:hypothetical protein [Methanomassiliicoccales archaeon]
MGRSTESIRMEAKRIAKRWERAGRALKDDEKKYAERLAGMMERHSSEIFYGFDDLLEASLFALFIELMKKMEKNDVGF